MSDAAPGNPQPPNKHLNPRDPKMESRLTDLEIKISFNEDQIEELNKVVYRQQQQIDFLTTQLRALREQVNNSQPQEQRNLRDEIPPHY
jgi:SlyX protein